MMRVVSDIERLSDHAENIVEYEHQVKYDRAVLSQDALKELQEIAIVSLKSVDMCLSIFANDSFDLIPQAEAVENRVDNMEKELVSNHIARLMTHDCNTRAVLCLPIWRPIWNAAPTMRLTSPVRLATIHPNQTKMESVLIN